MKDIYFEHPSTMSAKAFLVFLIVVPASLTTALPRECCDNFTPGQEQQLKSILKQEAGFLQSEMSKMCPKSTAKWQQLNQGRAVCFGAKDDRFGAMRIETEGFVAAMKLVHVSGHLNCDTTSCTKRNCNTKWGCTKSNPMGTFVTTASNRIVFPCHRHFVRGDAAKMWYKLPDFGANSPFLVFDDFQHPLFVKSGQELRLWYGEDLEDTDEDNNSGQTCADVFAWFV